MPGYPASQDDMIPREPGCQDAQLARPDAELYSRDAQFAVIASWRELGINTILKAVLKTVVKAVLRHS